ncbi:MAG: putative tail collar domain protein [Prokaryotic dsDNA virus sp.]|nr:MAG: putative tail collar domain protein [Prokaryotic dsDNA virus sp.]
MATYSKIKGDTALYLPVGTIMPWSKANVPAGFLYCDGSSVSRTLYADLFAVISTTFGSVDSNNFNLPDFQDRSAIGASNNRTFASKNSTALADQTPNITFPSATRNMSVTENINVTDTANVSIPAHTHHIATNETSNAVSQPNATSLTQVALGGSGSDTNFRYSLVASNNTAERGKTSNPIGESSNSNGAHTHDISGNVTASFNQSNLNATASAVDIENPYLAIRYMIKF